MVLLTGGPRLLHVLHQTSGLPSLTAYRVVDRENTLKDVHLTLTTMCDIENMVQTYVKKVLEISKTLRSGPTMWSVKVDEVATEKRLRYKTETNEIYGLCATHSKKENVTFTNIHVVEQLERCLEEETLHLATESCIFSLSSMSDTDYHAIPFLSFPICNHDTQSQQKSIFESIFHSWDDLDWNNGEAQHMLLNIGTDGESVRRSVLHNLRQYSINSASLLYGELSSLEYLDFITGPLDSTFDFDAKHLSKRIRNNLLKGSFTVLGVKFDAVMLKVLLKSTGKYKDTEIEAMINPVDKQNVPLAVKLLDALCGEFDSKNSSPGFQNILPSIKVLSVLCNGVLSLFARPNISIHESLGQLSAMAHMLLFLFGINDIKLPAVLYHDLQSTVQNSYYISAKYKIHCPDMPLYLYQVGSDQLE